MVFGRPSDGKVSLFSGRLRVLSNSSLDQESHTFFGVTCFSFMEGGKRICIFWIVDDFFP